VVKRAFRRIVLNSQCISHRDIIRGWIHLDLAVSSCPRRRHRCCTSNTDKNITSSRASRGQWAAANGLPSETYMGVPQVGRANTGDERECSVHSSHRGPRKLTLNPADSPQTRLLSKSVIRLYRIGSFRADDSRASNLLGNAKPTNRRRFCSSGYDTHLRAQALCFELDI
jgi:hypothetical protein